MHQEKGKQSHHPKAKVQGKTVPKTSAKTDQECKIYGKNVCHPMLTPGHVLKLRENHHILKR